jgi:hypothetical protein
MTRGYDFKERIEKSKKTSQTLSNQSRFRRDPAPDETSNSAME